MADIDLERKKGPGAWPWIIGLLALALIVWGVWEWMETDDDDLYVADDAQEQVVPVEPLPPVTTEPAMSGQSEVQQFVSWVNDSAGAAQEMGREHEFTRNGLQRLSAAMESLIVRDTAPSMQQHLQTVRQQVQEVQQSEPTSSEHAMQVKEAFNAMLDAMQEMSQRERMQQAQLGQHVDAARNAADSLNEQRPLLEQRDAVHNFFQSMAQALQAAERYTAV